MTAPIELDINEFRNLQVAGGTLPGEGNALASVIAAPTQTIQVLGNTRDGLKPEATFYVRGDSAVRVTTKGDSAVTLEVVPAGSLLAAVREAIPVASMSQEFELRLLVDQRDVEEIADLANARLDVAGLDVVSASTGDSVVAFDLYDAVADPVWRGRVVFNDYRAGQPGPDQMLGVVQGQEFAFVVEPDPDKPGYSTVATLQPGVISAALERTWKLVAG